MKLSKSLCAAAILALFASSASASQERLLAGPGIAVVQTKAGTLQGYVRQGIFTYKGVPYAEAERFMPPQPVAPWQGVRLALGSDLAAGHGLGIYNQVARSVQLSKLKWFYEPEENRPLSFANAFHMATRSGGALFGRVGCLEPGYVFDALVIRDLSDPFRPLSPEETVERFCYSGREDDILGRFIGGEAVSPRGERLGGAPDAAPCGSGT